MTMPIGFSNPRNRTYTITLPVEVPPQKQEDATKRPEVQIALQRWSPQAKEKNMFGMLDNSASEKPAIDFLANPKKLAFLNLALWTPIWAIGAILVDYLLQLGRVRLNIFASNGLELIPTEKSLLKFIQKNLGEIVPLVLISGIIEAISNIATANYQAETNVIALDAIKNKGINAKLGDA